MSAIEDIAAERTRQIAVEGWSAERDDSEHRDGSLARAAAAYAVVSTLTDGERKAHVDAVWGGSRFWYSMIAAIWPWHPSWFKPSDRRRDLVKAGALIVAEIERIDRDAAR